LNITNKKGQLKQKIYQILFEDVYGIITLFMRI